MADHEIRIVPKLDDTDLKKLEQHLQTIQRQFQGIVQLSQQVKVPGLAGAGSGPASPPLHSQQRLRGAGGRPSSGGAINLMTLGGVLQYAEQVIGPEAPALQQILGSFWKGLRGQRSGARGRPPSSAPSASAPGPTDTELRQWFDRLSQQDWRNFTLEQHQAIQDTLKALWGAQTPQEEAAAVRAFAQQYGAALGAPGMTPPATAAAPRSNALVTTAARFAAGLGSGLRSLLPFAGAFAAGEALVGLGKATIGQGTQAYLQEAQILSPLYHGLQASSQALEQFRQSLNRTGTQLTYSLTTIAQATQAYAQYVGGTPGQIARAMPGVFGFAYGEGLNPVTIGQWAGQMGLLGVTMGRTRQMTSNQLLAAVTNAIAQGRMQGRGGQVLQSLSTVLQNMERTLLTPPNVNTVLGILTQLNATGVPGLRGPLGAQVVSTLNQAVQHPGGGTAGEALMLQWLNPTGQMSLPQAMFYQSLGLAARNPFTGQTQWQEVLHGMRRFLGRPVRQAFRNVGGQIVPTTPQSATAMLLLSNVLHLSPEQAAGLLWWGGTTPAATQNATQRLLQHLQAGPQAMTQLLQHGALSLFSQVATATTPQALARAAQAFQHLGGHLSATTRQALRQAQTLTPGGNPADPGAFRQAQRDLARQLLGFNQQHTLQTTFDRYLSAHQKALAEWSKVGHDLMSVKTWIEDIKGNTGKMASDLSKLVQHWLHGPVKPPPGWATPGIPLGPGVIAYTPGPSGFNTPGFALAAFEAMMGATSGTPSGVMPASYSQPGSPGSSSSSSVPGSVMRWNTLVQQAAQRTGVSPALLEAVMWQESTGDPNARSKSGALGLMQLLPTTAQKLGVNPKNPAGNILGGARYLAESLQEFGGSIPLAIASYYAGNSPQGALAEAVHKYGPHWSVISQLPWMQAPQPHGPSIDQYVAQVLRKLDAIHQTLQYGPTASAAGALHPTAVGI